MEHDRGRYRGVEWIDREVTENEGSLAVGFHHHRRHPGGVTSGGDHRHRGRHRVGEGDGLDVARGVQCRQGLGAGDAGPGLDSFPLDVADDDRRVGKCRLPPTVGVDKRVHADAIEVTHDHDVYRFRIEARSCERGERAGLVVERSGSGPQEVVRCTARVDHHRAAVGFDDPEDLAHADCVGGLGPDRRRPRNRGDLSSSQGHALGGKRHIEVRHTRENDVSDVVSLERRHRTSMPVRHAECGVIQVTLPMSAPVIRRTLDGCLTSRSIQRRVNPLSWSNLACVGGSTKSCSSSASRPGSC